MSKSPSETIDAVVDAANLSLGYVRPQHSDLTVAIDAWRAAGSPKAMDLEEEISRLNQDVDRPMISERIGWINPEYHKKTVARLEADLAACRKELEEARAGMDAALEKDIDEPGLRILQERWQDRVEEADKERDAAHAENEKLKELLKKLADAASEFSITLFVTASRGLATRAGVAIDCTRLNESMHAADAAVREARAATRAPGGK